jgi:hypothetical protein
LRHDATLDFVTKVLDLAFHQVLGAYSPAKNPIIANPKTVRPPRVNWPASKRSRIEKIHVGPPVALIQTAMIDNHRDDQALRQALYR